MLSKIVLSVQCCFVKNLSFLNVALQGTKPGPVETKDN